MHNNIAPTSIKLQILNEKFKNLEMKNLQDREQLLSILNEGLIQQKLNESYMHQYYKSMIGNPGLYDSIVNPNNFQNLHQKPKNYDVIIEEMKGTKQRNSMKIEDDVEGGKGEDNPDEKKVLNPEEEVKDEKEDNSKSNKLKSMNSIKFR